MATCFARRVQDETFEKRSPGMTVMPMNRDGHNEAYRIFYAFLRLYLYVGRALEIRRDLARVHSGTIVNFISFVYLTRFPIFGKSPNKKMIKLKIRRGSNRWRGSDCNDEPLCGQNGVRVLVFACVKGQNKWSSTSVNTCMHITITITTIIILCHSVSKILH